MISYTISKAKLFSILKLVTLYPYHLKASFFRFSDCSDCIVVDLLKSDFSVIKTFEVKKDIITDGEIFE